MYGIEPVVHSDPKLVLPFSEEWIRSDRKWIRRFGVVTLRGYRRVPATKEVFELLDMVMEGEDRDVRKAVAWILREITKGNPDDTARYLERWAMSDPGKDAKWVFRNGLKRLGNDEQNEILGLLD